jgi:hypothetical protein
MLATSKRCLIPGAMAGGITSYAWILEYQQDRWHAMIH